MPSLPLSGFSQNKMNRRSFAACHLKCRLPLSCSVTVDPRRSLLAVLAALYTLSGLTSLAYEVLWARMLSQQFGVSIFGVVITVAAFMAGLGAGSWRGERWRGRLPPLLVFGLLEAAVAVYALCLPWLMHFLQLELAGLAGQLSLPPGTDCWPWRHCSCCLCQPVPWG